MKPIDVKSKIKVTFREVGRGQIMATGTLSIEAFECFDQIELSHNPELQRQIEEHVKEIITRRIYEDQRQALYEAVRDLLQCNPMDGYALSEAQSKILNIARFQKPSVN